MDVWSVKELKFHLPEGKAKPVENKSAESSTILNRHNLEPVFVIFPLFLIFCFENRRGRRLEYVNCAKTEAFRDRYRAVCECNPAMKFPAFREATT